MGMYANAKLCFGIAFPEDEEGTEFPWNDDKYDYDIDEWWMEVSGFVNPIPSPYNEHGNLKENFDRNDPGTAEQIDKFHKAKWDWRKANPAPVEVVDFGAEGWYWYVLAVHGTVISAGWESPVEIGPRLLTVPLEQEAILVSFCKKYGMDFDEEQGPKWWMSASYG